MTLPPTSASPDVSDPLEELAISGFDAGVISLATNILTWLDERPFTSLETLVIELRAQLEEVRHGIRADYRRN